MLGLVGLVVLAGSGVAAVTNTAQLDNGTCGRNLQLGSDKTASTSATPSFLIAGDGGLSSYRAFVDGALGRDVLLGRVRERVRLHERAAGGRAARVDRQRVAASLDLDDHPLQFHGRHGAAGAAVDADDLGIQRLGFHGRPHHDVPQRQLLAASPTRT